MRDRPLTQEPLALDLVDTQWHDSSGPQDLFDTAIDLREWLAAQALVAPRADLGEVRQNLLEARSAIRGALEGASGSWDALDAVLDRGRLRLRAVDGAVTAEVEVAPQWRAAWECARSFGHLLSADRDRVRRCEGQGCILWFLDTSRNGTRRWCSMAACGNRAKARTHYRSRRAAT